MRYGSEEKPVKRFLVLVLVAIQLDFGAAWGNLYDDGLAAY